VIAAASSEARKSAAAATSSGGDRQEVHRRDDARRRGIGQPGLCDSDETKEGARALTRIDAAEAAASERVRALTPPLAAV